MRVLLLCVLAIVTSAAAGAHPAAAEAAVAGYPLVMSATGDSITRAFGADGVNPSDQPARSWATGAEVQSHFARILAAAPTAQAFNDAWSGAVMANLAAQMGTVNTRGATYVTVLMGGNDACRSSESYMTPVADFAAQFRTAMDTVAAGSPTARVFVASIPDPYRLWSIFYTDPNAVAFWSTYGICQSMLANPQSFEQADADRRARVRQRVIDYNTQLQTICAAYLRCRFDGNAVFNTPFDTVDITADYFHPSTQGQNRLASVTWPVTFDFADGTPPVTTASTAPDPTGFAATLTAVDNVGVAGIETRLDTGAWMRYTAPVSVAFGRSLTYRAVDVNGGSEATASFAPVVEPVTLGAPSTGAAGAVSLSWSASPTAATHTVTYDVLRRPAGTGSLTAVANVGALAYVDAPPADGPYDYAVRAVVGTATSAVSNLVAALSDRTPPATTATTAAAAGGVSVTLAATDANGVGSIDQAIDQAPFQSYTTPVVVPFDHSLAYRATDAFGNVETTHTLVAAVPPPTLTQAATGAAGTVQLSWSASSAAAANTVTYTVVRRAAGGGSFDPVANVSALAYTDTPPSDGSYDYAVRAMVGTSQSAPSNALTALSDRSAPTASQLAAATGVATGTVDLSWSAATDAGSGVARYTVRWVQANSCPPASPSAYPSSTSLGNVTSTTVAGLSAGRRYCFYVAATDGAGNTGAASNIAQAKPR